MREIQRVRDFYEREADTVYSLEDHIHQEWMSIIRSALELYLLDLQQAAKVMPSDNMQKEIAEVAKVLSLDGVRKGAPDRFVKYTEELHSQEAQQISVFISFKSIPDGKTAGKIKEILEAGGLRAFVAHDDIRKGENWRFVLEQELRNCSIFVPVITPEFNSGGWPNQEVGFAYALHKRIISINLGGELSGFLDSIQGIKTTQENLENELATFIVEIKAQVNGKK